jgi:CPA1 family monovalent cation:H+ antiporter
VAGVVVRRGVRTIDPEAVSALKERILPRLVSGSRQLRDTKPDIREQTAVRRYLDAMRSALEAERSIGAYSSDTYRSVQGVLDTFEQRFSG